jgi:hypothetical protein
MQLLTHSYAVIYTGYLLAAYTVWEIAGGLCGGRRSPDSTGTVPAWQQLAALAGVPLIAVALGAAQVLPLAELAGHSSRSLAIAEAGEFALTPLSLAAGLLLPTSQSGQETIIYLGLVPLLLAGLGLRGAAVAGVPRRRVWFLAAVVGVAAVYALGTATPVFDIAYRYLPGMHWLRTPARAFLVAALAVAALAGLGAQRLGRGDAAWSNLVTLAVGATTVLAGLGLATVYAVNRATLGLVLLPALTLLVIAWAGRHRPAPRWTLPVVAGLVFLDLFTFGTTMIHFVAPADAFAPGQPVAAYLSRQPGLFRTYSPSYSLPAHVAAQHGVQTADGVEPVHLARYDRFMELAGGYGPALGDRAGHFNVTVPPFPLDQPIEAAWRGIQPDARLLGLLNVEYVVSAFPMTAEGLQPVDDALPAQPVTYVYRNANVLPRAWVLPETAAAPFLTSDAGPWWAEQLDALAAASAARVGAATDSASVQDYQADRIVVTARLAQPGTLVLSENWYPGWHAQVDGAERPVVPVAGLLRGVALEAGEHTVVLTYRPAWAPIGIGISLAAGLGIVVVGVVAIIVGRRRHATRLPPGP